MRFPAAVGLAVLLATAACSPDAPREQIGGSRARQVSGSCSASRDEILGSTSAARQTAIQRGFAWLDAQVPYSQSKYYEGYRTDCSGFVSMCWELGTSTDTAALYAAGTYDSELSSWDDLLPADALVHRSGGAGHVVLFLGWEPDKSGVCVLEQASTASDMQFRVRSVASLQSGGYKPIRANSLANDTGTATGTTDRAPAATDPTDPAAANGTPADPSDAAGPSDPAAPGTPADPGTPASGTPAPAACVPFAPLDVCNEAKLTRGIQCGTVVDNCGNTVNCSAVPTFGCANGETCTAAQTCSKPAGSAAKTPATAPTTPSKNEPPAPSGTVAPLGDPGDGEDGAVTTGGDETAPATPTKSKSAASSLPKSGASAANGGCSVSSANGAGSGGSGGDSGSASFLLLVVAASVARRSARRRSVDAA